MQAASRTVLDRELHPEDVDSPSFQDRAFVLIGGTKVPRFVLADMRVSLGDQLDVELGSGRLLRGVTFGDASFWGQPTASLLMTATTRGIFGVLQHCARGRWRPRSSSLALFFVLSQVVESSRRAGSNVQFASTG